MDIQLKCQGTRWSKIVPKIKGQHKFLQFLWSMRHYLLLFKELFLNWALSPVSHLSGLYSLYNQTMVLSSETFTCYNFTIYW